jgi:hypothetical protein
LVVVYSCCCVAVLALTAVFINIFWAAANFTVAFERVSAAVVFCSWQSLAIAVPS